MPNKVNLFYVLIVLVFSSFGCANQVRETDINRKNKQWTSDEVNSWYQDKGWLVGCNYIPATASNQLEMWQEDTFDPTTIDRELQLAKSLGFNSVRVFLHDLLWQQDSVGFVKRADQFLDIAHKHKLGTMFVLLNGVWDPNPKFVIILQNLIFHSYLSKFQLK
ncbi:MAG TPA: hypothetical protein VNI52_14600 [Sphingobacteriaceae bacterium]|nr:hypothetical protein [Sphingobacteriaceae bacterium]